MTDSVNSSVIPCKLSLSSAEALDAFALAAIHSSSSLNPAQSYLIGLSSAPVEDDEAFSEHHCEPARLYLSA